MGGEPGPDAIEGLADCRDPTQLVGQVVPVQLFVVARRLPGLARPRCEDAPAGRAVPLLGRLLELGVAIDEERRDLALDETPLRVVVPRPPTGPSDDASRVLDLEPKHGRPERDVDRAAQAPLPGSDGLSHQLRHPGIALQAGDLWDVVGPDPDLGHQSRHRREGDAGLPEGRQDLLDVAQKERVGTDHQHPLTLQREPVRVQEVGGPVQRDGRLPGSRAALDEQEPGQGRPDDLVLFALDRAHNVGHPAGAHGAECSQEGARTAEGEGTLDQLTARPIAVGIGRVRRPLRHGDAEVLVLVPDDGPRSNGQVTAAG